MGPVAEVVIERYPRLYHMAHRGSWRTIQEFGLRSTKSLLDLFEVHGSEREKIISEHRPESIPISHPELGRAVVRDQKPLSDKSLARALADSPLEPSDWYRLLNEKVFFWLTRERLNRMLRAKAYREQAHDVLVVNTAGLIRANAERIVLSPINSGCTIPFPHARGKGTFSPLEEYPFEEWDKKRSSTEPVVELAVGEGVSDIWEHVIQVEVRKAEELLEIVYERPTGPEAEVG